jgi:hypothetical protein
MKASATSNIVYVFPVFLFISACIWTGSSSGINATLAPLPSSTPTTITTMQTTSPTVIPGSFDDFHLFAAKIAAALQDKAVSFFEKYAISSTWTCLGEETFGICKDMPADTTLKGVPVTDDWTTYEVYSEEDYKGTWQTRFTSQSVLKLVAVANKFGGNPLMPMAGQSFIAIIGVAEAGSPASIQEVRVLFFEYYENAWYLRGELVTVENAEAWLSNTCSTCYDRWAAWTQ